MPSHCSGSSQRVRIVQLTTIAAPTKLHCEIVNLNASDIVKPSRSVDRAAEIALSGRPTPLNQHTNSALQVSQQQQQQAPPRPPSQLPPTFPTKSEQHSRENSERRNSARKRFLHQKDQQTSTNDDDDSAHLPIVDCPTIPTDSVSDSHNRRQHKRRLQLLSIFSKSNSPSLRTNKDRIETNRPAIRRTATRTTSSSASSTTRATTEPSVNNDKKALKNARSIDATQVTVHRVHFNCQPVTVVSLDGNNNVRRKVKRSDSQCAAAEAFHQQTNDSSHSRLADFGRNIATLWSNNSNKLRLFPRRHSKDKGRTAAGEELSPTSEEQTAPSTVQNTWKKQTIKTPKVTTTTTTTNMSSYVEKRSSVSLPKPSQLQQSSSTKEPTSRLSAALGATFGFSRSTVTLEQERSQNDTCSQAAPTLPPKGISRLPTLFSKLGQPTKIRSTGIPTPKLLGSKSIGNVSLDLHSDNSSTDNAAKHERRASFVSTSSCDNISTVSNRSNSSRQTKVPPNGAKKAQSSHNIAKPAVPSKNIQKPATTKSVSNLTNVSASQTTASKSAIPRSSRESLQNSGPSKMDQMGGRITETTTDRSTIGIPIRLPDKFGPNRKSCTGLQASAARFQQHQNQIYSQRMSFFGVPTPTSTSALSANTNSQEAVGGSTSLLSNNRQQTRLSQISQMRPFQTGGNGALQQHHQVPSNQNGNGRYSPAKSYNPYNRPQTTALPQPPSARPLSTAHKEHEHQSVNYVRDAVSRYQNQVMSNPYRFGIGTPLEYQPKSQVQQHTTQLPDNYGTYTKKTLNRLPQQPAAQTRAQTNLSSVPMDKHEEMSLVTAMVNDCQMRREMQRQQQHRQQQQQQQRPQYPHQQQIARGDTANTKCAIARASLALVSTTDDTDVEEEIEEMKHLERAPVESLLTHDAVMRNNKHKRECDDDLSLASVTSLASSSSSSSFVRHSERQIQLQQQQQQQHSTVLYSDAITGAADSMDKASGSAVDTQLTSSTHSALSTSTTSSFCFEQPLTHVQSLGGNRSTVCPMPPNLSSVSQNHFAKLQHRNQQSDASVSPQSSATASPSFHKIRTASSATTVSQDSNRDLFFDDEIADQPDLLIMNNNNHNNNNNNNKSDNSQINQNAENDDNKASSAQNRSSLRLSLARSLDYSSGSSSTTTTMAQENVDCSPLETPEAYKSTIQTASSELENLMQQISLTDQDYSSLNNCPPSPARRACYGHREIDRSRSFSFQNSSPSATTSSARNATEQSRMTSPRVSSLKKRHSYTSSSNGHVLRKPRPLSFVENEDGSLAFDSPSMRAIAHDIIGVKTLLFRLQGVLQNAETQSPFESRIRSVTHPLDFSTSLSSRSSLDSTGDSIVESRSDTETAQMLKEENYELRQHIQALEQDALEKDRTIRLLQQQMAKYTTGFESTRTHSSAQGAEQNRS